MISLPTPVSPEISTAAMVGPMSSTASSALPLLIV
jgi:hypothetical protein